MMAVYLRVLCTLEHWLLWHGFAHNHTVCREILRRAHYMDEIEYLEYVEQWRYKI